METLRVEREAELTIARGLEVREWLTDFGIIENDDVWRARRP
ncbi:MULTISPECIES: hypothetical protein [Acetobacter]|nr:MULTISPECIES: hypothetical protein [Acetobacter]